MPSEAQKAARDKWDRENMARVSCKITKVKAERFLACCTIMGTTRNAVLAQAIDNFIKKVEGSE